MGLFDWFTNLGYKQEPKPAPKYESLRRLMLPDKYLDWRGQDDLKLLVALYPWAFEFSPGTKRIKCKCVISGKNLKHPKNRQDESSEGVIVDLDGWTFSNFIFDDIPGGVVVKSKGNSFLSCDWTNIGEDAISTPKSKTSASDPMDLLIDGCAFYNRKEKDGGDKSMQFNNADNVRIRNTFVTGGITGLRLQDSSDKKSVNCELYKMTFSNTPTAINANGKLSVSMDGMKYTNVKKELVKGSNVKIR